MRKIILSMALLLTGVVCLSQTQKENGTIYINHPYIDIVNNSMKAYLEKDIATNMNLKVNYQAYANYQTLAFNTIDHRLSTTLTAKVNRFISVNLTGILLYDRDQDTDVQFSQTLGLGILYNVQNFTDPK